MPKEFFHEIPLKWPLYIRDNFSKKVSKSKESTLRSKFESDRLFPAYNKQYFMIINFNFTLSPKNQSTVYKITKIIFIKLQLSFPQFWLLIWRLSLKLSVVELSSRFQLLSDINQLITLALTLWAISAQNVRLFIKRTLRSPMLCTRNFFRPLGRWNLVFLSFP